MDAGERFVDLVTFFAPVPGVSVPSGTGFGSNALRLDGKIFAMLSGDELVVKLPANRVDQLVTGGLGVRYDGRKGRPLRQWLAIHAESGLDWVDASEEALDYARGQSGH